MNIYKKLMEARIKLQSLELKKTGVNKFAGYNYFELSDFIPATLSIFNDIGLCGVVSYDREVATLTIRDVDSEGVIIITSPMESANLKGCHPIQNLGAVETYQRRYLWVTAMEILEYDALDSSKGLKDPPKVSTITLDQITVINDLIKETKSKTELLLSHLGSGVNKVEEIPSRMYERAKKMLEDKKAKMNISEDVPQ